MFTHSCRQRHPATEAMLDRDTLDPARRWTGIQPSVDEKGDVTAAPRQRLTPTKNAIPCASFPGQSVGRVVDDIHQEFDVREPSGYPSGTITTMIAANRRSA